MDLDVSRATGWIESVAKRPEDVAEIFLERRRAVTLDWRDGQVVSSRAAREQGLSTRCRSRQQEQLVFVSDASEAGAREAIRSLQLALGGPPLPHRPERARPAVEPDRTAEVDRWTRRLEAMFSRLTPRHRFRWTLTEVSRQVLPAHGSACSSTRHLLSLIGTFTAASKRGDEVRPFAFHAPSSEATADELRVTLA